MLQAYTHYILKKRISAGVLNGSQALNSPAKAGGCISKQWKLAVSLWLSFKTTQCHHFARAGDELQFSMWPPLAELGHSFVQFRQVVVTCQMVITSFGGADRFPSDLFVCRSVLHSPRVFCLKKSTKPRGSVYVVFTRPNYTRSKHMFA